MPIGRPKEFDSEQALDDAMHLFWRQGYEATSMQNLLDTMHLSKSSLYQTYGSKHQLFQQCIERYRHMMTEGLQLGLARAPSGRAFIEEFFMALVDMAEVPANRIGCLIMNSATELAQRDKEIAKLITLGTEKFSEVFVAAIEQAQREGDISPDKNAQSMGYFLMSNLSGLNSMIKAGARQAVLEDIVTEIVRSLD